MAVKLVNLTPHAVNLPKITLAPSGQVARCAEVIGEKGFAVVEGAEIALIRKDLGGLVGLPEPVPGVGFIVSLACATKAWAEGRNDVLVPGEMTRDGAGKITGCSSLGVGPQGFSA
jgi:hypothetical protein